METLKFRTECQEDVTEFKKYMPSKEMRTVAKEKDALEGVTITFETNMTLDKVIYYMGKVLHGHSMYQTLAPVAEYTGIRNYDISFY